MLNTDYKGSTSDEEAGVLTWELSAYRDRVIYSPPSGGTPQVATNLSFAQFSGAVPVKDQAIHELLHPFGRQLALCYGDALSESNQSSAWNRAELGLFDARVEVIVTGLQRQLFQQQLSAPTVRFFYEDEASAQNRWLQGASELLGAALLQGDTGEQRADAIRAALLPALTALSGSCELSESGRDRMINLKEPPIFSSIDTSTIFAALTKGLHDGLPSRLLQQLEDFQEAEKLSELFRSVYGGSSHGLHLLLRDFTDCYPGPEFRAKFHAIR